MMEISYWWFIAEFWILCGVIGYSMFMGYNVHRFCDGDYAMVNWTEKMVEAWIIIPFGSLFIILATIKNSWTERDGMWL